ncbi:MAG: YihY/virulence factor BrkB family protein [Acidobacteriaceae bacterium]|nr:YihY/virulence factor BrkB family protein [Acidobacteriaceae bacterium]
MKARPISAMLHRTALRALDHDVLNLAQSAAYSAIVALFPALLDTAAIVAFLPDATRTQLLTIFTRFLPAEVIPLLEGYFVPSPGHSPSLHVLFGAALVSITGAVAVITTFMEGMRRARRLPLRSWTFWSIRARALLLVPFSLVPLAITSSLVIFGEILTRWLVMHLAPELRAPVHVAAFIGRVAIEFIGSVGLIALIYHLGTPERQPWRRVLPGAVAATAMWLVSTLAFGWYVTRFANYSEVYGSLGAGIALLFWLFLVSLSVLCGAEFNEQFRPRPSPDEEIVQKSSNSAV